MASKKYSSFKVGVFVLVAAVIVNATIFWAKGFVVGKDFYELIAYFPNVSGLNIGDPVTINGVKKGKVISFDAEGDSVKVEFRLEKTVKIKTDYRIEVTMLELMSGKQILINPGIDPREINYDKPLSGLSTSDISAVMKNVNNIAADVKELIASATKTTDNLNKVINNVNDIVGDKNMQMNLKSTLANLQIVSKNLNGLVAENRTSLKSLTGKFGTTIDNVNGMLDENSPQIKNTFKDIQSLTVKVDTLISNFSIIVSDIHTQKSGIGKFIYDDKFFENLNNTVMEIEKLSKKIRKDGVKINIF